MKSWHNSTRTVQTEAGVIKIVSVTSPEVLEALSIDIMMKAFRPAKRQKEALVEISRLEDGKVTTAQLDGEIIGYVTFHPPDSFQRWSQGPDNVLELGAIEVAPRFRNTKIGVQMLEVSFEDERMNDFIVLTTEYYWHWDLEGTGMHVWEYRDVMRRIMEHIGMEVKDTDEEEICSHPANILMARYGENVPEKMIRSFDDLLFMDGFGIL
ncbi:MAG: GNAT family N-acetyltransferase [Peptococcaceae bacterium]|nr:GNAT family N-acetyltransferase [Peptococcaceae bacterium]